MSTSHSKASQNTLYINSLMYTSYSSLLPTSPSQDTATTSPKNYQRKVVRSRKVTKANKKIILGKPITSKQHQKMSLEELKALSRRIRPVSSTANTLNPCRDDILLISKNLRENLTRAKCKMMDSLKKSNTPKDMEIYHYLNKKNETTSLEPEEEEDDCGSVESMSKTTSSVPGSSSQSTSSASTVSSFDDDDDQEALLYEQQPHEFMPLYTPDYFNNITMNMELFFNTPQWQNKTDETDVTEDQINSWLQRGGFGGGDQMSPITMATDQELADLLDFDM